ncbi:MAG: VOC family protein, partial [Rubricoccaceae bacterium]|nr:VOC family protein [Rubricoccaceae bacterium]
MHPVAGIHHITAVAGNAVENWRFYNRVLGERMVKKTVNFDDPGTYHLYYGDYEGSPGTLLTFFPWEQMQRGRTGNNQVSAVVYAIPENSLAYWSDRLQQHDVSVAKVVRFGTDV